jgi:hypothetical protein
MEAKIKSTKEKEKGSINLAYDGDTADTGDAVISKGDQKLSLDPEQGDQEKCQTSISMDSSGDNDGNLGEDGISHTYIYEQRRKTLRRLTTFCD